MESSESGETGSLEGVKQITEREGCIRGANQGGQSISYT